VAHTLALLRERRERQRGRPANKCDELASSHCRPEWIALTGTLLSLEYGDA